MTTQTLDFALAAAALVCFGLFASHARAARRRDHQPSIAEAGNAALALATALYFLSDALAAFARVRSTLLIGAFVSVGVAAIQTYRSYRRLKTPAAATPPAE